MPRKSSGESERLIELVQHHPGLSSAQIFEQIEHFRSYATVKRRLKELVDEDVLQLAGKGRATTYSLNPAYALQRPIDIEAYFSQEVDERSIIASFNFDLIENVLPHVSPFSPKELLQLVSLQEEFTRNVSALSKVEYDKEMERLAIDLSWKSSQIEGNTYSLLETERLLKEKETASGKKKDEAIMLLNHKEAIDFILDQPDYVAPLSVSAIEDIHSILIKDLQVGRNIRTRRVGITGTNYQPPDNEFQIKEALEATCRLVNRAENVFVKSFWALLLLSYIQPFADGNKRTARIVSNAILIHHHYCPISFRTVDSINYKKAMLLFYEQNNIHAFKKIFIEQFAFAVASYF